MRARLTRKPRCQPAAAWGAEGAVCSVDVSDWPRRGPYQAIDDFFEHESVAPLRTSDGWFPCSWTARSNLWFPSGFLAAMRSHHARMTALPVAA